MDPNLGLAAARVTEAAALFASRYMGCGDEMAPDQAAIDAVRRELDRLPVKGRVVVGEGLEGEAPKLFVGETLGSGEGARVDLALNPLEGATATARGSPNAASVIAIAGEGGFLTTPDIYMEKIAAGAGLPEGVVRLDDEPGTNLGRVAEAKGCGVSDLVVCLLDRPRHADLIAKVREAGARIMLIEDGDVSGVVATAVAESGIDIYMGTGGASEGVLAAAGLRCIGGQMQGRLVVRSDEDRDKVARCGITESGHVYTVEELARGEVMFAATGVTNGTLLAGVRRVGRDARTHTIVLGSPPGPIRWIRGYHDYARVGRGPGDS